jgi:hypothetical protein
MENDRYKFRVHIVETGERLPVYSLEWTSRGLYFQTPRIKDKNHVEVVQGYVKDGVAELEQCTGLPASKSYRGEKPEDLLIWEGDRAECDDGDGWVLGEGTIIYQDSEFVLKCDDGEIVPMDTRIIKIIGNVHEEVKA